MTELITRERHFMELELMASILVTMVQPLAITKKITVWVAILKTICLWVKALKVTTSNKANQLMWTTLITEKFLIQILKVGMAWREGILGWMAEVMWVEKNLTKQGKYLFYIEVFSYSLSKQVIWELSKLKLY